MKNYQAAIRLLNQMLSETNPFMRLLIIIIFMGASYLIFTFLGLLLAMPIFSITWTELQDILSEGIIGSNAGLLYYLQIIQSISLFIIPALLTHLLIFKKGESFLPGEQYNVVFIGFFVFLTLVLSAPMLQWLVQWNAQMQLPESLSKIEETLQSVEEERIRVMERLLEGKTWSGYLINIVIIAILPALGEEFFFRGILQKILSDWFNRIHLGIIIAAICFSAFHMQFYGFLPRLLLGIYFGYLFYWSNNIWLPVLAHFLNNAIAVTLSYFSNVLNKEILNFLEGGNDLSPTAMMLSVAVTGILIYFTFRRIIIMREQRTSKDS